MAREDAWTADETVVALAVALEVRNWDVLGLRGLRDLSELLRAAGNESARARASFRNCHGVARKMHRLAALATGGRPRNGAASERAVASEFAADPARLALAAREAVARLRRAASAGAAAPSRGPPPSFGERVVTRLGRSASVYVALFHGARLADGRLLMKVGYSSDPARRMDELNRPLPLPLGLRWVALAVRDHIDEAAAYAAEQRLLGRARGAGLTVGGEFVAGHGPELAALIASMDMGTEQDPGMAGLRTCPDDGPDALGRRRRRGRPGRPYRVAPRRPLA